MISVFDCSVPVDPFALRRVVLFEDVDQCRPVACLRGSCRHPARDRDDRLVIQGHGSYERQVLGFRFGQTLLLVVQRFLCNACGGTMSVLPSWVHPWRWYAAPVIGEALWRDIVLGESSTTIRSMFALWTPDTVRTPWRTLARWRRALLNSPTLFGWMGVGSGNTSPVVRLLRLLFLAPAGPGDIREWASGEVHRSAQAALAGTVHGVSLPV